MSVTQRLISPIAEVRREESTTALLMFLASFCAMAGYNVIKPITRSAFIKDLGADNLPWMPLATAFLIAGLMGGYAWLMQRLPRRWGLPISQAGMAGLLVVFWLLFQLPGWWIAAAFYIWGLLMGILLISQFWTLANVIYDPRQAKRLFGFIGAGAPLGGAAAGWLGTQAEAIGTYNLLLYSAVIMLGSAGIISLILRRERSADISSAPVDTEKGVGAGESIRLLRRSRHLQIIALVIMFAAIGAQIIEQQLNMAAQAAKGRGDVDAITAFLAWVGLWMSLAAFVIQAFLTSRIHRLLGIGFALFILPLGLGTTAVVMLLNAALWAPGLARVLDQSLRYTVDKTTREILFLPLPTDIKLQAKPFVDVTVDRFGKGISALLLLILVKDWGLGLGWQQISYASLSVTALWLFAAIAAKRGYLAAFRRSIERREVDVSDQPLITADLSTIETLVEELAHPNEQRVLYAIDVLESLDKRGLVSPLLLRHESPAVRARALAALARTSSERAERWRTAIEGMLNDSDGEVRAAALGALAALRGERAAALARPLLAEADPRLVVTAGIVLADSELAHDVEAAEAALSNVVGDARTEAAPARREVAAALRRVTNVRFRPFLITLVYDADPEVAQEAMRSMQALGACDLMYVPTLVSLLRHRRLKSAARNVLVGYGPDVLGALGHFLGDQEEDIWVRRHLPGTIARIGSQAAVDLLVRTLEDRDGFLRYKAIEALVRLRESGENLRFPREIIEKHLQREVRQYFNALTLHHNLFAGRQAGAAAAVRDSVLLARALDERAGRAISRIYLLLEVIYPPADIQAVRWALEHGDARGRASASEYLDNVVTGPVRRQILPALEPLPLEEKVRRGHVLLRSRPRDVEETLLQLINDEDQVLAAAAIDLVRELKEWRLKDDVEHVLAHRDVRDWYVFEAASWTLAAHRLGDERRRELWREPLPATELAQRLRQLPLFSSVWVDELFRLASTGRQMRHDSGHVLLHDGSLPEAAHVLLDGRALAARSSHQTAVLQAPAAIGLQETLEGRPASMTVRTDGPAVTLALQPDELRTLIADSPDLIEGLLRTVVVGREEDRVSVTHSGAPEDLLARAAEPLTPIARALLLQRLPLFAAVSGDELRHVSALAREVRLEPGALVASAGQAAAIYYVLSGAVATEPPPDSREHHAPRRTAQPGDALGIMETLAARSLQGSLRATAHGVALRIDRIDLIDLLAQRPALAQQVFASAFAMVEAPAATT